MKIINLIFVFLTFGGMAQSFVKGPYLLYDDDNTRMEVLWQMDGVSNDTLVWGRTMDFESGMIVMPEFGPDHQHRVILSGLDPGTRYFYKVSNRQNEYHASFVTAPPEGQEALTFFAYGDSRSGIAIHDRIASMVNDCWMDQESSQTFILSMGDLVTSGDNENSWRTELFDPEYSNIRSMMAHIPLMACRGNHEASAVLFARYFPYPFINRYYYSMDYGPAHFTFIDTYMPYKAGTEQYQWLVNDLANSEKPWKFVILHPPLWSAAGGHENNRTAQEILGPLFEAHQVAIVFAGHNHYYSRAVTMCPDGDSLFHVTTGGGGASLHTPLSDQPHVVTASRRHHFCRLHILNETLLQFTAISDSGEIIDQFSIDRDLAGVTEPDPGNSLSIHPNPFSDHTVVEYALDTHATVSISLYNLQGEEVFRIVPETQQAKGLYRQETDVSTLPPGIYLCKMNMKNDEGKRMVMSRKIIITR